LGLSIEIREGLLLAEDCLLAQPLVGPLTRKLPLKSAESAAIYDPEPTLSQITVSVEKVDD
jgi:hypothetical protein